tara:strand:- start:1757 stop:2305 length:549 start_codon:yes stop_codon:yes gene_type:complete
LFFKKILFFVIILFFTKNIYAYEKEIINNLLLTENIKFSFVQTTNEKIERGVCNLIFPSKLSCDYDDDKKKRIIIKNNNLTVIQRRYNKVTNYPIKNSPFVKILNKENLISFINTSQKNDNGKNIVFVSANGKIKLKFDVENYDFNGWEINDNYNNTVIFKMEILSKNIKIDKNIFKIPELN